MSVFISINVHWNIEVPVFIFNLHGLKGAVFSCFIEVVVSSSFHNIFFFFSAE